MKKILLLILCLSCHDLVGQNLETEIQKIMIRFKAIGASVAVVKNNRICYTHTFGYNPDYSDTTLRMAIPVNGVFMIQSISKTFISTAIMQLAEKKVLNIDDDVNDFLNFQVRNPNYPNIPITIRMLLNHRSTINDKHYGSINNINPEKGKKWMECYNDYRPGTKFKYCNYNYTLLGAIIEKVTGRRFFDYIDDNIMLPLGLNASYNLTKIDTSMLVRSYRYDKKTNQFKKEKTIYNLQHYRDKLRNYKLGSSTSYFSPSGGVKISAIDLAKYMMAHMNYGEYKGKRILNKTSELEMWKSQGNDTTYALGFFCDKTILNGEPVIGVRGSAHGVHSIMIFNPEKKFGIVVICNGCTADRKMKQGIAWVLYKHLIKEN